MSNVAPFQIIGGPMTIWLAPVGEAFPDLDTDPPIANWVALGASGDACDYTEDGVILTLDQEIGMIKGLGKTGSLKARRSSEDLKIGVTVMDGTVENASIVLNGNTITTVAPGASNVGTKKVGLTRGLDVTQYALLARGESPYLADGFAQLEIPVCVVSSSPAPAFQKGEDVAGFEMEFTALVDPNAASDDEQYGRYIATHLPATP